MKEEIVDDMEKLLDKIKDCNFREKNECKPVTNCDILFR